MARQKKPVHRVQMTEGKRNIIHQLLEEYDIQSAEDIQDALKDLLGGTIKEMMEAEMDDHLGYEKSERSDNDDYRNGYKRKQVNSRYGSMEIEVPQDRKSTFEPQIVKKRQKDISDIDQKIISMYAKGMTTRQISETIEDIYGFETSESFISLKNIINDAYAKDISRKIFTVKQNQRLKGEFVGNIPPYGYEKSVEDGHKLVINEETAPVIRKIFQLKEQKKTNTEIAKILEEEREIAPMTYWYRKGKVHHEKYAHRTWEATTIKTILANQMYTGDMVQGKKQKCIAEGRNTQKKQKEEDYVIVPNTHEALIDRSLFDKVQKICRKELEANREKRKKYTNVSSTEDLLKNKIFSAEGLKMYRGRNVYKNERVTYNYVTSKSRKNDGSCYKFVYISEEKVFQALKKAIYFYIELLFSIEDGHMDRKRKEKAEIEQKQLQKEIANSQKNVEWYTRRLADTYKEKTEGKIQMEDYIKKQTEYRACKEAAQEKIKELSDKYEIYKMQLLGNPDYFAVYENFLKTEELNKMLIDVLVKKITVAENAKIEITFQFEDEMRMLYERLKESCSA